MVELTGLEPATLGGNHSKVTDYLYSPLTSEVNKTQLHLLHEMRRTHFVHNLGGVVYCHPEKTVRPHCVKSIPSHFFHFVNDASVD